jgi:hypothetical protein
MHRLRRLADPLRRSVAVLCTVLVLALAILAVCPKLHAWLHGEKQLDDDDGCAVVLAMHGITPAAAALAVLVVALLVYADRVPRPVVLLLAEPRHELPPGRGPPAR